MVFFIIGVRYVGGAGSSDTKKFLTKETNDHRSNFNYPQLCKGPILKEPTFKAARRF